MLVSGSFLHGTLARNPLIAADSRCRRLIDEIIYYQNQPCLHQTWCPPAAIHREHSDMTNVLLICRQTDGGGMTMMDLRSMQWQKLNLHFLQQWAPGAQVFCYKSEIYVFSSTTINKYSALTEKWQSTDCYQISGMVRIVGDSFLEYDLTANKEEKNFPIQRYNIQDLSMVFISNASNYLQMGTIDDKDMEGLLLRDVTHIDHTELFFCSAECGNSYTVVSSNPFENECVCYPDQLGSASRLVTFRHDKEVFVLQENGCLWRIQLGDEPLHIHIENVLVLWDGDIPLNGAVLYNDELLVVGDFKDQSEVSVLVDICLPSVFKRVRKIKLSGDDGKDCPGITLAVLPKRMLKT